MTGNKAKQGWESKQKAYGEEEGREGAKKGGQGFWAKVGAPRSPAKSCGMGTSPGLLGLFSEHGQSHPLAWNRWVFRQIQSAAFLTI